MKNCFTRNFGKALELVAYDEEFAFYADPEKCDAVTTIKRNRKKITKADKREADALIDFLFMETAGNA